MKNEIPKREEHLEAFELFEGINRSKQFTVDNLYKAIRHITPEYIKEKRNNKENNMTKEEVIRSLSKSANDPDFDKYIKMMKKGKRYINGVEQLEFLDERVRLDFSEEENLTDNVNIE